VRVLVTRPEPDASRTAQALRRRGHEVLIAPLLRIEPVAAEIGPGPWAGVIVTSANAARALGALPSLRALLDLPVIAVGDRSTEASRAAGFGNVSSAGGNEDDLVAAARTRFSGAFLPLLYVTGEHQAGDVAGKLAPFGINVRTAVVYRAVAAETLEARARQALAERRLDGVLHYSRRSATTFLLCASSANLTAEARAPTHYCLSAEIAAPLVEAGAGDVRIAPRPDETALLDLIDLSERRGSAPP
jgi:uroporphyrinogen-III synthase